MSPSLLSNQDTTLFCVPGARFILFPLFGIELYFFGLGVGQLIINELRAFQDRTLFCAYKKLLPQNKVVAWIIKFSHG